MKKLVLVSLVLASLLGFGREIVINPNWAILSIYKLDGRTRVSTLDTLYIGDSLIIEFMPYSVARGNILGNRPSDSAYVSTRFNATHIAVWVRLDQMVLKNTYLNETKWDSAFYFVYVVPAAPQNYRTDNITISLRGYNDRDMLHKNFPYRNAVRSVVGLEDAFIDKTKTIAYYIDLNGRQVADPKGLVVAVYTDGTRSKVVFE